MGSSSSKKKPPTPTKNKAFQAIPDQYESHEEVQAALRKAGLESSNLVIAIDYTKSNQWTGEKSFWKKCLHEIDPEGFVLNPYQRVIEVIGRTLEVFDDDHLIPAYGFGDANTQGHSCFPFFPDRDCKGFAEVLKRYKELTPQLKLAGPTNFAPVIRQTIQLAKDRGGYHILLIVADGQVTNEEETKQAIVDATKYPISIVMVGVGDGPWGMMEAFDDELPLRKFDNFQFVEFNRVITLNARNPDAGFAIMALQEIPDQYQMIRKLGLL